MNRYTVWVGGVEANQYYITKGEAEKLAAFYRAEGYHDVYTPTSMQDLEDRLESFSGSEKAVAWLAAMMAWNLACDISNNEQEDK